MRKPLLVVLVALIAGLLVAGCGGGGGGGSSGSKTLNIGYIEWDENVAVSNLTKVVMENDLGYSKVKLQLADVGPIFQGVGSGDLAAFQDVWMPNHKDYLSKVSNKVDLLDPWYQGTTKYGIAVPAYMSNVHSLADLDQAGTKEITGIEPGAAFNKQITGKVIPAYNLDMKLVESSTPAMLAALQKAYSAKKPIVFLAWSPHWMNARYNIRYLADPKGAQGAFAEPSKITTVVNKGLSKNDPVAYAFLKSIRLNEKQVNDLELAINKAGDPEEGVRNWLKDNRDVVQPWVDAANKAQQN